MEREADHSPPYSAEIKTVWSFTSTELIFLYGVALRDERKITFTI
jgi:hypothetical protein